MIKCPICSNDDIERNSFRKKYYSAHGGTEYKLYHCHVCKIDFWEPRKISSRYYEDGCKESSAYQFIHAGLRDLQSWHLSFAKNFPFKPVKRGKLLDVGCGDGSFLVEAQKSGFSVYGIDFDRRSVKAARGKLCLKNVFPLALKDFLEHARKYNLRFDVITAFEVLEHQDDPRGFFRCIRELLTPNGYIFGCVPNRDRFLVDIERRVSDGDFPPHHFLWFSKESLSHLLEMEGFYGKLFIEPWELREMADLLQILLAGSLLRRLRVAVMKHFMKTWKVDLMNSDLNDRRSNLEKSEIFSLLKGYTLIKRLSQLPFLPVARLLIKKTEHKGPKIYFFTKLSYEPKK